MGSQFKPGGPAVALIEDEPLLRMALVAALEAEGYGVVAEAEPDQALALLRRPGTIDLAIVDVELPGQLDGIAVVQAARRDNPGLRVILTSGMPPRDDAQLTTIGPFLLKPYRVDALLALIAHELAPPRKAGSA